MTLKKTNKIAIAAIAAVTLIACVDAANAQSCPQVCDRGDCVAKCPEPLNSANDAPAKSDQYGLHDRGPGVDPFVPGVDDPKPTSDANHK